MAQRLIPGYGFVNGDTGERVRLVPGYGFANAPVSAGGVSAPTLLTASVTNIGTTQATPRVTFTR